MKFPINQLLYLVILGLLGLSGWQFWEALQEQQASKGSKSNQMAAAKTAELIDKGRSKRPDHKGPDYTAKEPWISFREANLIGKEPPPPPKPVEDDPEPETVEEQETPLGDICDIKLLYFDGDASRVVVRYKETANVQPPAKLVQAKRGAPAQPIAPQPKRPRGVAPPTMPMAGAGVSLDGWTHDMGLEDKLWPPYDHIRLVRVEETARFAEFVRSNKGEESEPEKLFKDELQMGQELLAQLEAIRASGGALVGELPDQGRPGIITSNQDWQGERSTVRRGNDYHIGSDDWKTWGDNPQRILNEEVGTRSYSRGNTKGVQVTKVSPRAQQLGIVSGDVVIAINGESVTSKAQATRVGKSLYRRGVRNFQVTFLSRGREVTRNYVAPDGN